MSNKTRLTKDEEQKKARKQMHKDIEWAKQIEDRPESTAEKILEQDAKDQKEKEQQLKDKASNYIDEKSKYWLSYAIRIAEYGTHLLSQIDWPDDWSYICTATDNTTARIFGKTYSTKQGIVTAVRSPAKEVFIRAIQTCMQLEIDMNAIETVIQQAENTLDAYYGKLESQKNIDPVTGLKKTKSGIILPK